MTESTPKVAKQIFDQELEKAISKNDELREIIQTYEQQKAEFEKKYPPIVEEKSEENKEQAFTNQENILPNNSISYKDTQINYTLSSN